MREFQDYLESFRRHLRLETASEREIVLELHSHLEEEVEELVASGLSPREAFRKATERFGSPRAVAKQLYDVHSRGSWGTAILGSCPHLLVALSFALHLWNNPLWLTTVVLSIVAIAVYGWWRGRPAWFYPWLGYSLVPLLGLGFLTLFLVMQAVFMLFWQTSLAPGSWMWLAAFAYLPLSLGLMAALATRLVRRDWIYASLMLLPLPILASWLLALQDKGRLVSDGQKNLQGMELGIAAIFVGLAVTAAAFIRFRQRLLKIGFLLTAGLALIAVAAVTEQFSLGLLGMLLLLLLVSVFLLSPMVLQKRLRREIRTDSSERRLPISGPEYLFKGPWKGGGI